MSLEYLKKKVFVSCRIKDNVLSCRYQSVQHIQVAVKVSKVHLTLFTFKQSLIVCVVERAACSAVQHSPPGVLPQYINKH